MNKASCNLTHYVNNSMLYEDALLQFCHTISLVVFNYYLLSAYYMISSLLNNGNTVYVLPSSVLFLVPGM